MGGLSIYLQASSLASPRNNLGFRKIEKKKKEKIREV